MSEINIQGHVRIPTGRIFFRTSRSSGPGGQNVNKLDTKVELVVSLDDLLGIDDQTRSDVRRRLGRNVDNEGRVHIVSQRHRSQWKNKEEAVRILTGKLRDALRVRKKRVPTRASAGSEERRLKAKKVRSVHKRQRRSPRGENEE